MSSGSPSQTVHEVGGPGARQPEQLPHRHAEQLPLQVVEGAVERRLRRVLAGAPPAVRRSPRARTDRRRGSAPCSSTKASADCGRLRVAVDRRRLAEAGRAVVAQLHLEHVVLVRRLAGDHERLGEPQRDDPGGQLHGGNPNAAELQSSFAPPNARTALGPQGKGEEMRKLVLLVRGCACRAGRDRGGACRRSGPRGRGGLGRCTARGGWQRRVRQPPALTASSATARGDRQRHPRAVAERDATRRCLTLPRGRAGPKFKATVPGVVPRRHRRRRSATCTQAQIDEQMHGPEPGVRRLLRRREVGLHVRARRRDAHEQRGLVLRRHGCAGERPMKRALHRGGSETLNVYSTTAGAVPRLGVPAGPVTTSQLYLDGIVVDWESMPGTSRPVRRAPTTSA